MTKDELNTNTSAIITERLNNNTEGEKGEAQTGERNGTDHWEQVSLPFGSVSMETRKKIVGGKPEDESG